jgi:plasmid stability protein
MLLTNGVTNGIIVLRVIKVMEVRQVRIVLPDGLHRDLKIRAIDEGMPLKELIEKALAKYISENPPMQGKLPFAQSFKRGQNTE